MNHDIITLQHHGILGMKWGVRRYQNKDGSLTAVGKKHVSQYKANEVNRKKLHEEGDKLIKSDKRLVRDFGKYDNVDDNAYLEYVAREYGLNTEKFWNSKMSYDSFYRENKESIEIGKKIIAKLLKQR